MTSDSAHENPWAIAEVVFGVPFLISIGMQLIVPLSLPRGFLRLALIPVGIVFIIIGMRFIVLGRREFARYAQPTDPGHPTSKVVRTGVFAVSRNPLYLGLGLIIFGIALAVNVGWMLVTLLLSVILCTYILIIPEERYLSAKFPQVYTEYMAAVHRWLGRK